MSNNYYKSKSLAGIDISNYSIAELKAIEHSILKQKIHGISFSPIRVEFKIHAGYGFGS